MATYFFLGAKGKFEGPLTRDQLDALARRGEVTSYTPIRVTGRPHDIRYWDLPSDAELPDAAEAQATPRTGKPAQPAAAWTPPRVPAQPSRAERLIRELDHAAQLDTDEPPPLRERQPPAIPGEDKPANTGSTGCGCFILLAIGIVVLVVGYNYPFFGFLCGVALIGWIISLVKKKA